MSEFNKEKAKKLFNRKVVLGLSALLVCAILIGVCSFIPFIIDPKQWQTTEFLTDELIICAIIITSMISMMFIGQAGNAQKDNSDIAKARVNFFASVKLIVNITGFCQWIKKVFQPKDIQTMKERIMREVGITDFSVIDLEYSEIRALLETPQKYNDKFYKGLSKKQIDTLIDLKRGKYKVKLVEPSYYLSVKNIIDNRTITERSSSEGLKTSLYLARSIISKVVLTVITAMIFASLMKDLTTTVDYGKSWLKFVSRLWAMISSAFMGYIVGCQINDINASYIDMRIEVHKMYLEDKTFVPMDEQEEARQEFIERVSKEQVTQPSQFIEQDGQKIMLLGKKEE